MRPDAPTIRQVLRILSRTHYEYEPGCQTHFADDVAREVVHELKLQDNEAETVLGWEDGDDEVFSEYAARFRHKVDRVCARCLGRFWVYQGDPIPIHSCHGRE